MDPNNPHWSWSWLDRWMAARPCKNENPPNTQEKNRNIDRVFINSTATNCRPPSRQSPSTPKSMRASTKLRPASPRCPACGGEDDSSSINSIQSEKARWRLSIAGSSVRDDESLASSPAVVHGFMALTESARARAQLVSPLGGEKAGGSAKKRLSFNGSPVGPRRLSGLSPMNDISAK